MKILLVMPGRGQIQHRKLSFKPFLPPGSVLEVAGMTPQEHEVHIWDELAQGPTSVKMLDWADIVGISGLSTSHFGAFRVADLARRQRKLVIGGGMHVTGLFREEGGPRKLGEHYDAIVVGRLTRQLWQELLWDAEEDRLQGVYCAKDDDPWEFVIPRHDLIDPRRYEFPATIRTSAGCSESCNFCTVHLVCGRKVHTKPYEILKQELEFLPRTKRPLVDCSDSFGAVYHHTTGVVLPLLRSSSRRWFTEITIKNLLGIGNGRESLIGPMADAGCMGVYIGIESIHQRVGAKSPERRIVEQAIKDAHKVGLIVLGSLILDITGNETEESIRETVEWVIEQGLDLIQYSLVAALPGSALRRQTLARGIVSSWNPEHHDGAWPTVKHLNLSPEQLIELLRYAYYRTYSVAGVGRRILGHSNLLLNLLANIIVHQLAHRWWGKVGYEHWLATRNLS